MAMSPLENLYGGYLVGQIFSSILLGIISVQAFLYYQRFPHDHIVVKSIVAVLWILQMFHLVVSAYSEWSGLIVLFGRPLTSTKWINTVYQLLTVICSVIVQFFFAYRLRQIAKSSWLPSVVIVMTIAQLSTGLVIWIRANISHGIGSIVHSTRPLIIAWLTIEAASDLLIAASMSLYLRRMRTGFPRTDSVVRFLTIYAVNTGLLTSLAAMAIMFAFAFYGFHFVHECFILPLGGLYTASLLANLHSRSTIRERLHRGNSVGESIHLSRLPDKVREDISRVVQGTRGGISNPESNQTASTHPRV